MQAAHKSMLFALFAVLVAGAAAQGCKGDVDVAELPYSLKWTTTGDAESTTFVVTVCNTACASPDSELCRPLKSLSIGASSDGVTTFPESKAGGCGPTFSGAALNSLGTDSPSGPEHCEAFYVTAPEAGAAQAAICGGKTCTVQMVLDNGVTAAGSSGFTPSEVSPTPAPTPSPTPSPTPYGRRRSLQQVPEVTTTAYGKRRSLQQAVPVTTTTYGKRRLTQQH